MRVAQFMIFMLLISSHIMAENEPRNEVKPTAESAFYLIQPDSLPATPQPQKVIDKKFIAVMGTLGVAQAMRFTTRTLVLEHEKAAGAPWVTTLTSDPHLIAKAMGIYAAEVLVAYEIKKPHAWLPGDRTVRKLWWLYPATMTAVHFKNAAQNISTKGPRGNSVAACELQQFP